MKGNRVSAKDLLPGDLVSLYDTDGPSFPGEFGIVVAVEFPFVGCPVVTCLCDDGGLNWLDRNSRIGLVAR